MYGLSDELINKIRKISTENDIKLYIFGSRARGDYKNNSDLDIAIKGELDDKKQYEILSLFDLLDIPYMLDIIFINKIKKKELLESIKRDGIKFE